MLLNPLLILSVVLLLIGGTVAAQQPDDTLHINEVVVTGARVEVLRNTMPVNITVLQRHELNEVEESAVLPLLSRKVPGMFISERGVTGFGVGETSAGQVTVRGIGGTPNTQVLMLVDGQPQYMGIFGHPLPNSYVASDLERVEIIRGPGSTIYGSNAMGGVINFITRQQESNGFSGGARLAYGSFNTSKVMFNGGYKKDGFHIFASLNRDATDGHRADSEFEINNAYVRSGYFLTPKFEVTADYTIASFRNVDPGADFANAAPFVADIVRGRTSVSLKNNHGIYRGGLTAFLNFGDHELSDGWKSKDENMGISLYQGITLPFNSLLTAGADYKQSGGRGNAGVARDVWNHITDMGIYALMRHQVFNTVHLSYGLRLENSSLFGNELIPQGGIAWQADDKTSLKASVSKGFRSPTVMETYLFLPNPTLKPERMMSYELGVSRAMLRDKLQANVNLFLLRGSNIIQLIPNPSSPPPMQRVNTGEFTNSGFEVEFQYYPNESFTVDLSYSWLDTHTPLLVAPRQQLYAGFGYTFKRLNVATQAQYIEGLYTYIHNPLNQTALDDKVESYLLVNASASLKLLNFADVFVSVKNLLNQSYQINNGYPMPGTHLMTGINISF